MKTYKDITYRYLKGQKNRTLLTIVGIILSVAMISAIGTIIISARGALLKEAIRDNGSYHAVFEDIDKEVVDRLKNHVGVDRLGVTGAIGHAPIVETTEQERSDFGQEALHRYIDISSYDDNAMDMLPIKLGEGRLPQSPDEIIIEDWMANYFDKKVKIGDRIRLPIGERAVESGKDEFGNTYYKSENYIETGEKEYEIVGFIKPDYIWKSNLITKGITALDLEKDKLDKFSGYFTLPKLKDVQGKFNGIAKDIGMTEEDVTTNFRVLRLYAQSANPSLDGSLRGILAFVVILIMASTIAVIYNSFNISVLERISQFGLLRSIGATPKQIRSIVLREAAILSAIAIPIGLFSGVWAMKIVFYIISLLKADIDIFNNMEITFSATVFIISTIVGLVTVFLSAIGPARQAGRVTPMEAVRNTGEIKKETLKKIKSSKLTRRILGVEGDIARKNLRRNRKRFLITMFSMVISIILFITFSYFSGLMFQIAKIDEAKSDFEAYGSFDSEKSDEIYKKLMAMEDINKVYKNAGTNGWALLKEDQINKKIIDLYPPILDNKKGDLIEIYNVEMTSIGNENLKDLKKVLKSGSIDIEDLNKENGVLVNNNTLAYKENSNSRVLLEGYKLKVGDKIPFASYGEDMIDENTEFTELTVVGVIEKGILGEDYNYNGSINMITTEEILEKIYQGSNPPDQVKENSIKYGIELVQDGERENISSYLEELKENNPGFDYVDRAEMAKDDRAANLIMSIFLYGFITLIALISAINIINTISTNIILRTREIAMIKAVGMSQSGIKKMVAFESIFYGFYASIIGGLIGTGLSYLVFRLVNDLGQFNYKIPLQSIAIACGSAIIIALLSGIYPLRRINHNIIVESMKVEN